MHYNYIYHYIVIITQFLRLVNPCYQIMTIIVSMNIKNEIKVAIARKGTTLKEVCEKLSEQTGKYYSYNNISNKMARGTIKFNVTLDGDSYEVYRDVHYRRHCE